MSGEFGTVSADGDRMSVRFDRFLPTEPADLWDALTEPARLARWFGAKAAMEPAVGGAVEIRWDEHDQWVRGEVLVWDPPKALSYGWRFPGEDESVVRFDIEPAPGGSLLHLTHSRLGPAGSGYGPAWHAYLDVLAGLLDGREVSWEQRFAELRPEYAAR